MTFERLIRYTAMMVGIGSFLSTGGPSVAGETTRPVRRTVETPAKPKAVVSKASGKSAEPSTDCYLWNCIRERAIRIADHATAKLEMAICPPPVPQPYLLQAASPGIRVSPTTPAYRRPPMLPTVLVVPRESNEQPSPAKPAQPSIIPGLPAPDDVPTEKSPKDEAIDFFRDSGSKRSDAKGLGETFDPTFPVPPAPVAPLSSATYRRE